MSSAIVNPSQFIAMLEAATAEERAQIGTLFADMAPVKVKKVKAEPAAPVLAEGWTLKPYEKGPKKGTNRWYHEENDTFTDVFPESRPSGKSNAASSSASAIILAPRPPPAPSAGVPSSSASSSSSSRQQEPRAYKRSRDDVLEALRLDEVEVEVGQVIHAADRWGQGRAAKPRVRRRDDAEARCQRGNIGGAGVEAVAGVQEEHRSPLSALPDFQVDAGKRHLP